MAALREELFPELACFQFRLDPEFLLDDARTVVVLGQRGAEPALLVVQRHQRAMHPFEHWIERQEAQCGGDGLVDRTFVDAALQLSRQHADGAVVQLFPLRRKPSIERRLVKVHALEQVANIGGCGLAQVCTRGVRGKLHEPERIDGNRRRIEAHRVRFGHDQWCRHIVERAADEGDRLAQTVSRLRRGDVTPEKRGEGIAAVCLQRAQREVRQERLCLVRTK